MSSRFSKLVAGLVLLGVVLLAVAAVMLWRGWTAYRHITSQLEQEHARLIRLQTRDPYPSEKNVAVVAQNAARVTTFYREVMEALRQHQVEPMVMEPADFPALLEKEIRALCRKATRAEVVLPEDFTFGFARYVRGEIPSAADLERLTIQLQQVVRICGILFDAGVAELLDIERQEFERREQPAERIVRRRRRPRRVPATGEESEALAKAPQPVEEIAELVAMESYRIQVRCSEPALWKLLQGFANAPFCAVVTSVEVENEKFGALATPGSSESISDLLRQVFALEGGPQWSAQPERGPLTREERVVAGREKVNVTLQLNVYRLRQSGQEEL